MSILVTGATGFVGTALVEALLGRGLAVVAFADRPFTARAERELSALPGRLTVLAGNVLDRAAVDRAIADHGVERVVHGAVITSAAPREASAGDRVVAVNLGGLATVVAAAAAGGVARFLMIGSTAAYGDAAYRVERLDETVPHDPVTLYAIAKSTGERITARIGDLNGLDWRVGRIGTVFGPWERDTGLRDTLSQPFQATLIAREGGRARFPRPCFKGWQYARDAARNLTTLLLADAPEHRIYNLAASPDWSLADWCDRLRSRFPGFAYAVGDDPTARPIELFSEADPAPMVARRFEVEFGPPARFDLDAAFAEYMRWLDDDR